MIDDDECGAVGGMIGRGNSRSLRKPSPMWFVLYKAHIISNGLKPGPPW
jgi:hypothetical protein